MAVSLDRALASLIEKMVGKRPTSRSVEGMLQFAAEHYNGRSGSKVGPPGVGIKDVTGSIDKSNKLTLTFTMTDESSRTVVGTITTPKA